MKKNNSIARYHTIGQLKVIQANYPCPTPRKHTKIVSMYKDLDDTPDPFILYGIMFALALATLMTFLHL